MSIKIGFIGADTLDIMHYLSRVLVNLGKTVLLLDLSEDGALNGSVPIPVGMDARVEAIDYRGVEFMRGRTKSTGAHDYTLIDLGYRTAHEEARLCSALFYVTDLQTHNVERINVPPASERSYLILRDTMRCKISPEFIVRYLDRLQPVPERTFLLPLDKVDRKSAILCAWDSIFRFNDVSGHMRDMLYIILTDTLGLPENEVRKAYRKAERGR